MVESSHGLLNPLGKRRAEPGWRSANAPMDGRIWQCNPALGHKGEASWADENTENTEQMVTPAGPD